MGDEYSRAFHCMTTSWHGYAFHIIDPLWGESIRNRTCTFMPDCYFGRHDVRVMSLQYVKKHVGPDKVLLRMILRIRIDHDRKLTGPHLRKRMYIASFDLLALERRGSYFTRVFLNYCYELLSPALAAKLVSGDCQRIPLIIGQHWFR